MKTKINKFLKAVTLVVAFFLVVMNVDGQPVNSVAIGEQPNALGWLDGPYRAISADPRINTVSIIHRGAPNVTNDATIGYLRFDMSKDGGATWASSNINNGPVYKPSNPNSLIGPFFNDARYPQCAIYNPSGNTIADSAYLCYFAPTLDGTNYSYYGVPWGGHAHGVYQLSGLMPNTQTEVHSTGQFMQDIPSSFTITQNGTAFSIDAARQAYNTDYTGNIIISKGIFNPSTHDFDYNASLLNVPLDNYGIHSSYLASNIAFAPDGMTGYLVVICHGHENIIDATTTSPKVFKTTDGGITWGYSTTIILNSVASLLGYSSANGLYTTGYQVNCIVDGAGNLHLITPVGPGAGAYPYYQMISTPGTWGMFDIFTLDGGLSYKAKLLAIPQTFSGTFGIASNSSQYTDYNRGQTTSTFDGNKLFFTWYDTDLNTWPVSDNTFPDMHTIGYDVASQMWTPDSNITAGIAGIAGTVTFGNVAQYAFSNSGVYNIPAAYQVLNTNPDSTLVQTQLYYLQNVNFSDADFTVPSSNLDIVNLQSNHFFPDTITITSPLNNIVLCQHDSIQVS